MRNARAWFLSVISVLLITCSLSITPILSHNTQSRIIQSRGEIAPPAPQLRVNGLYLEDGSGNRVRLKGIQVDWNQRMKKQGTLSGASFPEESWFTIEDVGRMKEAGANCVEIVVIGTPELMPTRNVTSETFFSNWVDKWVSWATQHELYIILNIRGMGASAQWWIDLSIPKWLWQGLYPQPTTRAEYDAVIRDFFDLNVAKQDVNREAFINLWKFIANRYKNNPYVVFSIMNEPFNQVEIPNEATAIHLGLTYSTYMERIVDAIRSTGAQQLVFIDHPFLMDSKLKWTDHPVNRDNIVWEAHNYVTPTRDFNYWKSQIDSLFQKYVNEFGKPLFIGEYGFDPIKQTVRETYPTTWETILSNQVSYLDNLQIAGRQWHQWGYIDGECYDYEGTSDFTAEESEWIIQTTLGGQF